MKLNYSIISEYSDRELRLEFNPDEPFLNMVFKNNKFGVKLVVPVLNDFRLDNCKGSAIIGTDEFVEFEFYENEIFKGTDDTIYKYYIRDNENNIVSSIIFSKSIINEFISLYNEIFINGVDLITTTPDNNEINIRLLNGKRILFKLSKNDNGDCLTIYRSLPDNLFTDVIMNLGSFRLHDIEYDNIIQSSDCVDFRDLL